MVQGGPGDSANCLLALSGHLICGQTTTAIPAGTGKVTRKLVQGSTLFGPVQSTPLLIEVSFFTRQVNFGNL